ncbi:exonuclease domain-containing protein [Thiococcus pfennigii]|uniref:exonuclease domain-containing protein n=1 Tax=Thiococcus pfennigii TaxID=1057 RepID=UPI001902EC22|nr:DNA polymerase III subunit epsilon [Thiococcus pfennigii]
MEPVVVIDFETTGLSPDHGDRATEIAAVLIREGQIVARYQSLMNAGRRIPAFITQLTGITDAMVRAAPPASQVMAEVADFVGDHPLIAHNAAFDRRFWEAELRRIGRCSAQPFACSMLLARRLLPEAPNHKLGTLAEFARLPVTGRSHRAQADAEMAAHLTLYLEQRLIERFGLAAVTHPLLGELQRTPKGRLATCLGRYTQRGADSATAASHGGGAPKAPGPARP